MCYGLMASAICVQEATALIMALGSFLPSALLCGMLWPIQTMPDFLQHFTKTLPLTLPTNAARNILSRGWGLDRIEVIQGFAIVVAWTVFFLFVAIIIFKRNK